MRNFYMPFRITDYYAETPHLSALEHGAYMLLLFAYWSAGSLPKDDERRRAITKLTPAEWRRAKPVLQVLFSADDQWRHARLDQELEEAKTAHDRRVNAGRKGGKASITAKQCSADASSNASEEREQCSSNAPSNARAGPEQCSSSQQSLSNTDLDNHSGLPETLKIPHPLSVRNERTAGGDKPIERDKYPSDFKEFWRKYPTNPNMSKLKAAARWHRMSDADRAKATASLPAFKAFLKKHSDHKVVHACRYLSERRFDGYLDESASVRESKNNLVFVEHDSAQWHAWLAFEKKRSYPTTESGGRVGWYFLSEWPPNRVETAA